MTIGVPGSSDPTVESGDAPVLVVGAGPAGSAVALHLARAGRVVTIVDRAPFPRAKACGECANPGTVAELRALGLDDRIAELRPGRLRGWDIQTPSGSIHRAAFRDGLRSWTLDRSRLDAVLLEAAVSAGARFEPDTTFEGMERGADPRSPSGATLNVRLRGTDGRRGLRPATMLVGADGLHSRVRKELETDGDRRDADARSSRGAVAKAGLSVHVTGVSLDPRWGRLVLDPDGTLGLSALDPDGDRWTLVHVSRTDDRSSPLPSDPEDLLARAAASVPEVAESRTLSPVLGSGPYDRPVDRVHAPGMLLVGDAAGYFDPVTGQGIGRALRSARLAADAILAGGGRDALRKYEVRLRASRRHGVQVQRIIEAVVRRPALLERIVPAMTHTGLLDDLIAVTGDVAPASGLWAPSSWPRWGHALVRAALVQRPRN